MTLWEDPLEEEMATHSSILTWSIPWAEEPGEWAGVGWGGEGAEGYSPQGHRESDTTQRRNMSTLTPGRISFSFHHVSLALKS